MLKTDGESKIKDLTNTTMSFLVPHKIQQSLSSFTVPDIFSIYGGDTYISAKAAISKVITDFDSAERRANAINRLVEVC